MAEFILKDQYGKEQTFDKDAIYVRGTDGELICFSVGGGSSADVCYVTFMNEDGTEECGKIPVAVGYDCPNPKFDAHTKESTDQYDFVHAGWATEPNGALNEDALKAVTEDRTVYANFASILRYYTQNFYDGETLLESQSVAYGSTPVIANPTKDGYSFSAWEPALAPVTGDTDYYAQWAENITFSGGSWADIAKISENGEAAEYFAVGDTKSVTFGDATVTMRIIDFDHDDLSDGSGKAGMTIVVEAATEDTFTVSSWATLAANMKSVLKPKLPSDLQSVIKPVYKKCDTTDKYVEITPVDVEFELFPLSWDELKILRYAGRLSTDDDWRQIIAELGTPYAYYVSKYSSTYRGPNTAPWHSTTNAWFRQYFRFADTTNPGTIHCVNLITTGATWATIAVPITEKHPVIFAFCI